MFKINARLTQNDNFELFGSLAAPRLLLDMGDSHVALGVARPLDPRPPGSFTPYAPTSPILDGPVSPSFTDEVGFLTGLNPNGTLDTDPANSYWGFAGETARKWDTPTAGTGAVVTYAFNPASSFTANEQLTFLKAFGLWEAVCDIAFVEAGVVATADVLINRGNDGGAFFLGNTTTGSGSTLGSYVGQTLISIDDSTLGFELTGDLDTIGGYGMSTVIHEVGHMIGLGHGGYYNGAVDETTQQYSAFDERQWSIMSYIFYAQADTAKYRDSYTVTGTDWGVDDGFLRQAPHSWMPVDILAAQWLYGASTSSALDGGDTFGFNSTIGGVIEQFFDFTINDHPVITLFSLGAGNTLDASGFSANAFIDLRELGFSDLNGHVNNVVIARDTVIETGIGGSGNDTIQGNVSANDLQGRSGDDLLIGGLGDDSLFGGVAADTLRGGAGGDALNGAGGVDWADYSDAARVIADLQIPSNNNRDALGDSYISIENLRGGDLADNLRGDGNANRLEGGGRNDTLSGRAGDDILVGGQGYDQLAGQQGVDAFLLTSVDPVDYDRIVDLALNETILLDAAAFGLPPGALDPDAFVLGNGAQDAEDRLIYLESVGKLFFDPDGAGGAGRELIAIIENRPSLDASDFLVI